ncbi:MULTISPECIES: phage baseplate assembly protein V [Citricoccus]|uniref:phage baseplate assembly protein V n=1 Tax=Citricoccus TaxID=169133 RepID=UPI000255F12C|nr:phage baseplate assembly protein V [Citricoccus sp. CH26A]
MPLDLEDVLVSLAEQVRNRHYGKYRGIVRDIEDPLALGRIRAEVPAVLSQQESPWAMPCVPYAGPNHGLVLLPETGDGVWIEFEAGDLSRPIWSGCWWADGQLPTQEPATSRLLATGKGHRILLDEDKDEIKLTHPGGAELVLAKDSITLTIGQSTLTLTDGEIVLNDGMAKVTTSGASLVRDAFTVGG